MTNAEFIAKIRAEIERLKNHAISSRAEFIHIGYTENAFVEDGRITVYDHLLSFLSDLEKSLPAKVADGEDLNREIEKYFAGWEDDSEYGQALMRNGACAGVDECKDIARHFYDLGCRRTADKYDELEYNRQREEGRVLPGFEDDPKGIPGKDFVPVEWVETLERYGKWKIVKLEEDGSSEIPKDLAIAAESFAFGSLDEVVLYGCTLSGRRACFIAGAKWDRKQMMKEGLDAVKTLDFDKVEKTIAGVFVKYGMDRQKELMMKDAVDVHIAESFNPVSDNIDTFLHGFSCTYEVKESTPYVIAGEHVKIIFVKED